MQAFELVTAADAADAVRLSAAHPGAAFVAGGTTVVDLMKHGVVAPPVLIDIGRLPLDAIELRASGVRIGALARNSDVAYDPTVERRFPMLAEALLAGASAQLRNMASVGGNLLQRTRCPYFRDPLSRCNKRHNGDGCDALEGVARGMAILGTSDACIAAHASDAAVALVALDAVVEILGPDGSRRIPLESFYLLPGTTPEREHALGRGELIVAVDVPFGAAQERSTYVKVRDRASYEFALVSAAVGLEIRGETIAAARIALGGVGTIPWRARTAESALLAKPPSAEAFRAAAEVALAPAVPRSENAFKVALAKRALVRALERAARR